MLPPFWEMICDGSARGLLRKSLASTTRCPIPPSSKSTFTELQVCPSEAAEEVDNIVDSEWRSSPPPPHLAALNYVADALHNGIEFLHNAALDVAPAELVGFDLSSLLPGP